jgi:hypothetical protein
MSILYDSIPPSEMEWLVPLAEKVSAERSLRIQRWIRNHTGMQMPSEVATTIFREAMTCVLHKVHEDSYADVYRKVASILAKNSAAKRKVQAQRKASFEPSLRTKKPTGKKKLFEQAKELGQRNTKHTQETLSLSVPPPPPQTVTVEKNLDPQTPETPRQVQPVFGLMAEVDRTCTLGWETGRLRTSKHRAGRW